MAEDRALNVTELTNMVKDLLEGTFPSVSVEGEITNCRPASSGHLYFALKDRSSMIQAVMFRYRTRALGFEPADGMLVRARGAVTVYAARGQYQLLVERMSIAGEGDLLAMLEERKRRLAAEGLFDEARKPPLPRFPERVAVITSPTGAAIRDILNVLGRRNSGIDVLVLPAAVQGEAAPAELVARLRQANRWGLGDVIILGRGGGSIEDLLAFSDEALVRAVAESRIPVISAVGHEIDWALSDFAASLRAPTPSAAAELVSESREALAAEAAHLASGLEAAMRGRLDRARLALGRFDPEAIESRFMRALLPATRRFDEAREELARGMREAMGEAARRLELASRELEAMSPEAVLARGFAVVRPALGGAAGGDAIRDAASLAAGQEVEIRFARGGAAARVEEVRR
ncbi:MAG TPA: exodeoxyribonuclease VII large subunit [Spirochaetia bacterium]|nr:exodeoxyribonuclease VII large subunit [Spirochaetia bacterium]HRZ65788.1 exodeoxyribonuclease VII large subunit [Spirochaetia bacterium]